MKLIIAILLLFLSGCYAGSYSSNSDSFPQTRSVYNPQTGDVDIYGNVGGGSYMNYDTGEIYAPVDRRENPTYLNYETGEMYWPIGDNMYQDAQGDVYFVH